MNHRRGAMFDLPPSPLPQNETGRPVVTTQLVNAFWQFLPAKSTTFWSRIYFSQFPRPLFIGKYPPYPATIPIAKLQVPRNQGLIIKDIDFTVYQKTGVDTTIALSPSEVASYLSFSTKIGNKSPFDFQTNTVIRNAPTNVVNPNGILSSAALPSQGTSFPFSGPQQPPGENFAAYADAGETIDLVAYVLREPPFDVQMVSAKVAGYNINQNLLQTILSRITA
jgi:hypothetical protein